MKHTITDDKLTFKIDTEEPIEINDLIKSLKSISNEYGKFSKIKDVEVKVSEVRKGSFIFDMILFTKVSLLPILENTHTTIEFVKKVIELKDYFLNKNTDSIEEFQPTIGEAKMMNAISNHSQNVYSNCTINIYDNNQIEEVKFNEVESKQISKNTMEYISYLKENEKDEKETVLKDRVIKLVQRRFDDNSKGNKAICEHISKKEITTVFENDDIRKSILDEANDYLFVVDMEIQYSNSQPILYKVLQINDKIEIDNDKVN